VAVSAVQASQAWRLREFTRLGVATYMAGPSLMVAVMLVMLWVTGVSLLGVIASAATGCAAQLLAEKAGIALRSRRRNHDA
jgi:hypothetical protein